MKIPFLDLVTPHVELEEELTQVFRDVVRSAGFIGGPQVEGFEREFAEFCDVPWSVGVANGTDALRFAVMAAGVKPGDTVITVPNTFIATTEAISQSGANPDFVDVDEETYTLDPEKLHAYLVNACEFDPSRRRTWNKRTGRPVTAVIPVHLYGQMADMDPILALCREYNLTVIEDACQAHGAEYYSARDKRWYRAGSMGKAAAFSFYPGKNLGACGEAGAVTTSDQLLAQRVRMLREHGQSKKYFHDIEGYNGRLDALQAGLLRVKLRHLACWNDGRRAAARVYDELLDGAARIVVPKVASGSRPVYHLYVVRVGAREAVQRRLSEAGIGTGIHYPVPLHLSKAYDGLGFKPGDFPITEKASTEILSLPMFPNLSREAQVHVVAELMNAVMAEYDASVPA
jgi:dTDP-4-amino-4,6-dideoxygalactose transaminase